MFDAHAVRVAWGWIVSVSVSVYDHVDDHVHVHEDQVSDGREWLQDLGR
jgi:hypothetical protein